MKSFTQEDCISIIKTCDNFIKKYEAGEAPEITKDGIAQFRKDKKFFEDLLLKLLSKRDWNHPEQLDGEVFLLNVADHEDWGVPPFCESTRVGNVAYTTGGKNIVTDLKPLFGKLKK